MARSWGSREPREVSKEIERSQRDPRREPVAEEHHPLRRRVAELRVPPRPRPHPHRYLLRWLDRDRGDHGTLGAQLGDRHRDLVLTARAA